MRQLLLSSLVMAALVLTNAPLLALDKSLVLDIEQSWHQGSTQSSRLAAELELAGSWSDNSAFTAIFRGQVLGPDQLEPGEPSQAPVSPVSQRIYLNSSVELELRELYLDIDFDHGSLRLGKQQVVWGQADGLKLLDLVNPQEFRSFILDDFDDSRIPLWMINAEFFLSMGDLQFLWVPDTSMHNLPEAGASFELTAPFANIPSSVPVVIDAIERPDNIFKDGDVGVRLARFLNGWDLTANYLYHYDDLPVFRSSMSSEGLRLSPTFERTHTLGGSASSAFGDFIFRAEFVLNSDKYFATHDVNQAGGVQSTREIAYVLGLDWTGLTDTFFSVQIFQSYLLDDAPFIRDDLVNNLTLLARRSFMNENLKLELLWIFHDRRKDNLLRISVDYELTSNTRVSLYGDFFSGETDELFGQFDERDRMGIKVSIGF